MTPQKKGLLGASVERFWKQMKIQPKKRTLYHDMWFILQKYCLPKMVFIKRSCYPYNFRFTVCSIRHRGVQVLQKNVASCKDLYQQIAEVNIEKSSFEGRLFNAGESLKLNSSVLIQKDLFNGLQSHFLLGRSTRSYIPC